MRERVSVFACVYTGGFVSERLCARVCTLGISMTDFEVTVTISFATRIHIAMCVQACACVHACASSRLRGCGMRACALMGHDALSRRAFRIDYSG
jgi:hypothetical protein